LPSALDAFASSVPSKVSNLPYENDASANRRGCGCLRTRWTAPASGLPPYRTAVGPFMTSTWLTL
jgi:hypothetical protein